MKTVLLILSLLSLILQTSCTTRIGDMNIISTRSVKLDKIDLDDLPKKKRIEGESSKFIFLFIPFGLPKLEEAVDDALDKGDGDILLDAVVYDKSWWFLIGQNTITIKGSVADTKGTINK
jgi:hypothetical protein